MKERFSHAGDILALVVKFSFIVQDGDVVL